MRPFPNRILPPGDPSPWVIMKWMDITGPSEHSNGQHEELYLRRLYLLRTPWFGIMLHQIRREDWDRDALHNHPWTFWALILRGGYTEEVAYPDDLYYSDGKKQLLPSKLLTHNAGKFRKFPDGAYHRITSVKPHTWTLVFNGAKDTTRTWGFFVPGRGHVPWREYVNGAR